MTTPQVPVEQAAATALVGWLTSQLAGVTIKDEWPDPGVPLVTPTVTVLTAGELDEEIVNPPQVLKSVPDPPPAVTATYWFRTHWCSQPLQIDAWASSKPSRNDLIKRLGDALTAGKAQTLSAAYFAAEGISPNQDPVELSIVLQLAAPYDFLVAAYQFDAPDKIHDGDSAERKEWRASYRGFAYFDRVVSRNVPQLLNVSLPVSVTPSGAAVPVGSRPTLVVTPSSTTITRT